MKTRVASNRTSLLLFVLGINLVYIFALMDGFELTKTTIIQHVGFFLIFFSFIVAVLQGGLGYLTPRFRNLLLVLCVAIAFMLVNGVTQGVEQYPLSRDCFALTLLAGILIGAKTENWRVLEPMLLIHFVIGAGAVLLATAILGVAPTAKNIVWDKPYRIFVLMYPWQYFLLTIPEAKLNRKLLTIFGLSVYVLFSILFVKRSYLAIFLVTCIPLLFRIVKAKRAMVMALVFSLMLFSVFALDRYGVLGKSFSALEAKYHEKGSVEDTVLENYRLVGERKEVIDKASDTELLFGRGLGSEIPVSRFISPTGFAGETHSGLWYLFLKGGTVYATLWFILLFMMGYDFIRYLLKYKKNPFDLRPFYIIVLVNAMFMPVATFVTGGLTFGFLCLCMGICMSNQAKQEVYRRRALEPVGGRRMQLGRLRGYLSPAKGLHKSS